jgi:hypothetical protein
MKWNIPIFTFLQRTWMLLAFSLAANWAALSNYEFFKHWTRNAAGTVVYQGWTLFDMFGGLVYIPGITSAVMFFALLCIHLFWRESVDKDAHDGTYLDDWHDLTPEQRVRYSTLIRIGIIVGFCILCAGLARG